MTNTAENEAVAPVPEPVANRVTSPWNLMGVLAGLLLLTAATVAVTRIDLGAAVNLWMGVGIAALQATLVAVYFMRLRWDDLFNAVVLVVAMFFVALFIGIVVLDSREYHPDLSPPTGAAPQP